MTRLHLSLFRSGLIKKEYKALEKIKIYIKGNKPFYARVLYKDVKGELIQLLPNPYRKDNYFNGGVIYKIPSGNDRFSIIGKLSIRRGGYICLCKHLSALRYKP